MHELEICYTVYRRIEKRTYRTVQERDYWMRWWENNPNCHWVKVV